MPLFLLYDLTDDRIKLYLVRSCWGTMLRMAAEVTLTCFSASANCFLRSSTFCLPSSKEVFNFWSWPRSVDWRMSSYSLFNFSPASNSFWASRQGERLKFTTAKRA
ncbi:hypothetical protein RchiOBHm_Chr3g0493621 [Rosa chinensis]|uniref:Uncharacterized protein n=1 Tax=Rosa chinensis TaxID=74649 RepID=A0A2P6RGS8_ROSCH|nr:hypothetical protein RchiOBHm_Chr3g0493621 [Rosa chinensis]